MKIPNVFLLIFLLISSSIQLSASNNFPPDGKDVSSVLKVENVDHLFQWGNAYLGGQPNLKTMEMLQKEGVDLIICLRSDDEMEEFANTAFNEEKMARQLGMNYLSVPVSGPQSYCPETLEKFNEALNTPHTKVLVHCRSCGRVTQLMMAYLVKYEGYSLDDAVAIGKKLKYESTLEMLLGQEISMSLKKN